LTEKVVKVFVYLCQTCNKKQPKLAKHVGAIRPIVSNHFRDRFQADYIDFCKDPQVDVFGIEH
jgi:hypothetical protein